MFRIASREWSKYKVIFRKDYNNPDEFTFIAAADTLTEASSLRQVAGDLVVNCFNEIVTDPSWLFDWEKENPDCWARRAIAWQSLALQAKKNGLENGKMHATKLR